MCNKSSSTEKNNEALNGKDLMIERKEQSRKVNKKNIKNERNFDIRRNNRHQMTSKTEFLKKCYQVPLVEIRGLIEKKRYRRAHFSWKNKKVKGW